MDIDTLRQRFQNYFSKLGYKSQSAANLVPENDPSVLFTTAGMQQFKYFYQHPDQAPAQKLISVQPVIRTSDIDEVGDDTHLTMFEMLGNFSFGHVSSMKMKETAAKEYLEFFTKVMGLSKDELSIDVFAGDEDISPDYESEGVWHSIGVKLRKTGRDDTFWGPTGDEGPCGPSAEIYVKGLEVGTLVFNQYYKSRDGKFAPLDSSGIDVGLGLERLSAVLQGKDSVWQIEPFEGWVSQLNVDQTDGRIIIDHLRAIIFIASSGIEPGNKGREYVLRRLIRKVEFLANRNNISKDLLIELKSAITHHYSKFYTLDPTRIANAYKSERERFSHLLGKATAHLENWLAKNPTDNPKEVTDLAFQMVESFGFPKEMAFEYLISQDRTVDSNYFDQLFSQHQETSRHGSAKQFKSGLADHNEQTIKHHTATHMLLAALRQVLGPGVHQQGSNVTSERLRLDFSFDRPLTDQEKKQTEDLVNKNIQADLPVRVDELTKEQALATGALAEFGNKYGESVTIYSIGDFSKEFCAGPHVSHTGVLGKFAILKEIASSRGVRRIKARTTWLSRLNMVGYTRSKLFDF